MSEQDKCPLCGKEHPPRSHMPGDHECNITQLAAEREAHERTREERDTIRRLLSKAVHLIQEPDNGYHACRWCSKRNSTEPHDPNCPWLAIRKDIVDLRQEVETYITSAEAAKEKK